MQLNSALISAVEIALVSQTLTEVEVRSWGNNAYGECDVPAGPPHASSWLQEQK